MEGRRALNPTSSFFSYVQNLLLILISLVYVLLVLYYALTGFEGRLRFATLMVPLSIALCALINSKEKGRLFDLVGSILLLISSFVILGYMWIEYPHLIWERAGAYNLADMAIGVLSLIVVIETTRRSYGLILPIIVGFLTIYVFFGRYFPGIFHHLGISIERYITTTTVEFTQGVFGLLPQVGVTWIAIFLILAGFVYAFGTLDSIIKFSRLLTRGKPHHIPQTAILSSMVVGMFSGSAAANVAATGSFTIPTMKRYRIPSHLAGAIESVASTGGQIMPPIMGAAVFLMCELLGKRYFEIMVKAFIPAIIFYLSVSLSVYIISRGIFKSVPLTSYNKGLYRENQVTRTDIYNIASFIMALIVLVIALYYYAIMLAGLYATLTYLLLRILFSVLEIKTGHSSLKTVARNILEGVKRGAEFAAPLVVMLSCMGIIVSLLTVTGFTLKLVYFLVELSHGNLIFLLLLVMLTCILFGMGVPTVAAYLLTVILAAPALIKFGIIPLNAHFFVFYFAIVSGITPPVAICCATASKIADSSFLKTCIEALKLGIPLFILPFTFIFQPEILSGTVDSIYIAGVVGVGLIGMCLGVYVPLTRFKGYLIRASLLTLGFVSIFYPIGILSLVFVAPIVIFSILFLFKATKRGEGILTGRNID